MTTWVTSPIGQLFQHIYQKDGRLVAVKPHQAFKPYFTALQAASLETPEGRPGKRGDDDGSDGTPSPGCDLYVEIRS